MRFQLEQEIEGTSVQVKSNSPNSVCIVGGVKGNLEETITF